MATESSTKLTIKESVENNINNLFIGNKNCQALYEVLNICNQKQQKRFNIYIGKTPVQANEKIDIIYNIIPYLYGVGDDAGEWTFFGSGTQAIQQPQYYNNMTSYNYSGTGFDTSSLSVNIIANSGAKGKIISTKTLPKNPNTTYFKVVNNALEYDFSSISCTKTDGSDSNIVSIKQIFANSQLNTSSTVSKGNYHKHTFDLISNETNKSIGKINYYVHHSSSSGSGSNPSSDSGHTIYISTNYATTQYINVGLYGDTQQYEGISLSVNSSMWNKSSFYSPYIGSQTVSKVKFTFTISQSRTPSSSPWTPLKTGFNIYCTSSSQDRAYNYYEFDQKGYKPIKQDSDTPQMTWSNNYSRTFTEEMDVSISQGRTAYFYIMFV